MSRLIDCIVVNDELDLLRQRIEYLLPHVDHFVIVEARQDHRGLSKPAHVAASGLLSELAVPVSHIVLDTLSNDSASDAGAAAWARERSQRNAIGTALVGWRTDDVAIVCDVDEFPSPAALAQLRHGVSDVVRLSMEHCILYSNLITRHEWRFPYAVSVGEIHDLTRTRFAVRAGDASVAGGGWHFSYLGGPARIAGKLAATAHVELDQPVLTRPRHIRVCRTLGCHPTGTFKILRRVDPQRLPAPLRTGLIGASVMPCRPVWRSAAAVAYSAGVSLIADENWRVRAAKDWLRARRRTISRRIARRVD